MVTLCVTVCVPGPTATTIQSSGAYPDMVSSPCSTSCRELQVLFITAETPCDASEAQLTGFSRSTVMRPLQLAVQESPLHSG